MQILLHDCTFISTIILGRYFVIVVVNCDSGPCRFFLGHSNTHRHTHTHNRLSLTAFGLGLPG